MHNVIVGTAGHVDHGKTWLIKALTGTDTDRLKEEKIRGITIELGFAEMPNPYGQHIGIVDVPGHEKFVRNMLAGIGGIDLVLLVIAADEGVMPQTVEHFEILKMLDIKKGIIVLTKSDLVDEDWLALVTEDVRETVRGTFLETAPIMPVSVKTGENIEELKELICEMARDVENRKTDPSLFRLPIDRVFTIGGFGTVVTGTLAEGQVSVGDEVQIYPGNKTAKVRSLQVHGSSVDTANAGQRTAVNLLNIKKDELERGNVLAAKGSLKQSMMLDVKLKMFDDAKRALRNESRVHLYYGSAEALSKVILLDHDVLENGEEGYAQLRLEEEIAVRKGDRFIIRFYSPVETIGGGQILDAVPIKHKRYRSGVLEALKIKEQGDSSSILEQTILENQKTLQSIHELISKLGMTEADKNRDLDQLISGGRVVRLSDEFVLHVETLQSYGSAATAILSDYHERNPILPGMQKSEFRKRLSDKSRIKNSKIVELVLRYLVDKGMLKEEENRIALPDFKVIYSEKHMLVRQRLLDRYLEFGFEIPEVDEEIYEEKDKETARQLIEALAAEGLLKKIDFQHYMHITHWDKAMNLLRNHIQRAGMITLAEYRDLLGTSRKYAVMILEYLDEQKITTMEGDARIIAAGVGKEW